MSFSVSPSMTSCILKRPDSAAIVAWKTTCNKTSPSSSTKASSFPASMASNSSYASSSKYRLRLSWVCSRSHGQPPGERSVRMTASNLDRSPPLLTVFAGVGHALSTADRFLQRLARLERRHPAGRNLDGLAGRRVHAAPGRTVADFKRAEPDQRDFVTPGQRFGDLSRTASTASPAAFFVRLVFSATRAMSSVLFTERSSFGKFSYALIRGHPENSSYRDL